MTDEYRVRLALADLESLLESDSQRMRAAIRYAVTETLPAWIRLYDREVMDTTRATARRALALLALRRSLCLPVEVTVGGK